MKFKQNAKKKKVDKQGKEDRPRSGKSSLAIQQDKHKTHTFTY
jgi:hypothetical protein